MVALAWLCQTTPVMDRWTNLFREGALDESVLDAHLTSSQRFLHVLDDAACHDCQSTSLHRLLIFAR